MTPQEFNKAVEDYSDRIYRFVLKSMDDSERSKDVVQDCYEKLWINVEEIDFSKSKAWLFTTAHNTMIDIIRKDKKIITDSSQNKEIYEQGYTGLNEILHRCLGRLNESWRSVILLRDYEGYSYREIGEITGQSEAQVKINIYRARMAMRNMIGKMEMVV
ncbi:MAG TPA: RNA polymerase sigma factor [Bacteroidales bacterium]|nr:RNA polymerase sigma factor [Bacteroidales bacterium]